MVYHKPLHQHYWFHTFYWFHQWLLCNELFNAIELNINLTFKFYYYTKNTSIIILSIVRYSEKKKGCSTIWHTILLKILYNNRFVVSRSGGGGSSGGVRAGASRESSSSTQERPSEFSRWRERQYFGPRRWLESALRDTSWDKEGGKPFKNTIFIIIWFEKPKRCTVS